MPFGLEVSKQLNAPIVPYREHSFGIVEKEFDRILEIVFKDLHEIVPSEKFGQKAEIVKAIILDLVNNHRETFRVLLDQRHDFSTILHSISIMVLSVYVYEHIKESAPFYLLIGSLDDFALASLLHDMGKINTLDLVQKTEHLSDEEMERMRKHPDDGVNFIKELGLPVSPNVLNAVKYHQRRYDGTGYPEISPGEYVGELAHLIALIDSLEAMTSRTRVHNAGKEKINVPEAMDILHKETIYENKYSPALFQLVHAALL